MEERTFNQLYPKTGNGALRTSNHAPVVNTVIEDQSLVGGEEWVYNLPEDSFVD